MRFLSLSCLLLPTASSRPDLKQVHQVSSESLADVGSVPIPCASRSIGLRFQKFDTPGSTLPDRRGLYPVSQTDAAAFAGTQAVSMRFFGDDMVTRNVPGGVHSWQQVQDDFLEGNPVFLPTHPDDVSAQSRDRYWEEMEEVVAAQQMRRQGLLTSAVFDPLVSLFGSEQTMEEGADLVRADFPTDFPTLLVKHFLGQATLVDLGLTLDDQIFRQPICSRQDKPEFVNGGVALSGLISWAITQVSPVAFASKWYNGRMRPEETAMMVTNGCFDRDVPAYIKEAVLHLGMETAVNFTAYDEGSPVHPAYPAMHSAASSISTWLELVSILKPEQRAEAQLLDFSIAYYRTFAGVHWDSDNRAGLQIGRAILVRALPDHLAEVYGCNSKSSDLIRTYVTNKIPSAALNDWATWTPPGWRKPTLRNANGATWMLAPVAKKQLIFGSDVFRKPNSRVVIEAILKARQEQEAILKARQEQEARKEKAKLAQDPDIQRKHNNNEFIEAIFKARQEQEARTERVNRQHNHRELIEAILKARQEQQEAREEKAKLAQGKKAKKKEDTLRQEE